MKTSNQITQLIGVIFLCTCSYTSTFAQDGKFLYKGGTNWQAPFYDLINSKDPTVFRNVIFETETEAQMWDRDANYKKGAWTKPISWIFKLNYSDKITAQIRIRKRDFTKEQAVALANKYGKKMGQLPACLREGVDDINIMKSNALFGGNNSMNSIDITIGATSELYEKTGNMEETLFHESTHAALDYLYKDGKWNTNRDKDPQFISEYAANNPNREDISESFVIYTLLAYKSGRISKEVSEKIRKAITHRMKFYDNMKLNMHPIKKSSEAETATIKISQDLEVMTYDLGKMGWDQAIIACAKLGDGWRLPTKDELNILYKNKNKIGGFSRKRVSYWSSTVYDYDSPWVQGFRNGHGGADGKDFEANVRAVRTF